MSLKSEGFASCISDPEDSFPLKTFCAAAGLPYQDIGLPVPIETFIAYGQAFQKRLVPELEQIEVAGLTADSGGFVLTLANAETVRASKVVISVGVGHFPFIPEELAGLPRTHFTHSSNHSILEGWRGRDLIVIGGGASALEMASLLHQNGATVRVIARRRAIDFHSPPERGRRSLVQRIKAPRSGLGLGWRSRLCEDAPLLFRVMPQEFRLKVVERHLGPAPGWFVREHVEGRVPMLLGSRLKRGSANGVARVVIDTDDGEKELETEHVIAATGYKVDLGKLPFLNPALLQRIRVVENTPVLSSRFETSVRGLFFIGPSAANCFGPLMRFACGNRFVSRRLAPYLT